jgi:hypothetical protein
MRDFKSSASTAYLFKYSDRQLHISERSSSPHVKTVTQEPQPRSLYTSSDTWFLFSPLRRNILGQITSLTGDSGKKRSARGKNH